jgi:hypothetical protein
VGVETRFQYDFSHGLLDLCTGWNSRRLSPLPKRAMDGICGKLPAFTRRIQQIREDSMRRPAALFLVALAVAFTVSQPPPAHADNAKRPPGPPNIPAALQVPPGNQAFREGDAWRGAACQAQTGWG